MKFGEIIHMPTAIDAPQNQILHRNRPSDGSAEVLQGYVNFANAEQTWTLNKYAYPGTA